MKALEWSAPKHGVQHLGRVNAPRWATVNDYGTHAVLLQWFSGCGFDPHTQKLRSAEEARKSGEAWVLGCSL